MASNMPAEFALVPGEALPDVAPYVRTFDGAMEIQIGAAKCCPDADVTQRNAVIFAARAALQIPSLPTIFGLMNEIQRLRLLALHHMEESSRLGEELEQCRKKPRRRGLGCRPGPGPGRRKDQEPL